MTDCLLDGPANAGASFIFAHGAGAPMDSEFMNSMAEGLGAAGIRVVRFEFPYMAERRKTGKKRPPPRAETMMTFFSDLVKAADVPGAVFIGGKSMGGRIASMIADELGAAGRIRGLICLGYPFHPPGKPERLRMEHLATLRTPALICQGERDPFGTAEEVAAYRLSNTISLAWLTDGNHDLAPRKASGATACGNWARAVTAVAGFIRDVQTTQVANQVP